MRSWSISHCTWFGSQVRRSESRSIYQSLWLSLPEDLSRESDRFNFRCAERKVDPTVLGASDRRVMIRSTARDWWPWEATDHPVQDSRHATDDSRLLGNPATNLTFDFEGQKVWNLWALSLAQRLKLLWAFTFTFEERIGRLGLTTSHYYYVNFHQY